MNGDRIEAERVRRILDVFDAVHRPAEDPTIESVHVALMLEDVFDVTFGEDELAGLTDRAAIERAIAHRPPQSEGTS